MPTSASFSVRATSYRRMAASRRWCSGCARPAAASSGRRTRPRGARARTSCRDACTPCTRP
eukprot:7380403-Prymnesium_polylepis.1